jgi:DNA polymerase III epsilon subunit family exonuclease
MSFTIVDIETTGLSAYYHKITEIAALKYHKGKVVKEFSTLVNPEVKIPRFITRLTGIDDKMVKNKPTIDEVIPKFCSFLGSTIFVAHAATFDYKFLDHSAKTNMGINLSNDKLCTCKLARRLLPELPSKKLSSLCEHFKLKNDNAHRAMSDAKATVKIFHNFLGMMKEKEIHDIKDVLEFQTSKIPRVEY